MINKTKFSSTCLAYFLVHNTTVLTKIINDVNHILSILDKKTKATNFAKRKQETTIIDKIDVPVERIGIFDTKKQGKDDSPKKKKNHHKLLKSFFDIMDGNNNDGDIGYDNGGNISGDRGVAEGSGDNADEPNVLKRQYAHVSLNDLEDDMENEVNTLVSQLGSSFTRDASKLQKVVKHPSEERSYSKGNGEKSNADYYERRTPDADEDILDMITNILADNFSRIDQSKEENAVKLNYEKGNNANGSASKDTYFISLTSNVSKNAGDLDKKSSLTFPVDKFSETNVAKNHFMPAHLNSNAGKRDESTLLSYKHPQQSNQNLAKNFETSFSQVGPSDGLENFNDAIPVQKQRSHQRSSKDLDIIPYSPKPSVPNTDLEMSHETSETRQKYPKRKAFDEKSEAGTKRLGGKVNGNNTEFILKVQTIPTPSSQLLQIFPGAVSYNVKLTNEESPPGKGLNKKLTSQTTTSSNSSRQSNLGAAPNRPSGFSARSSAKTDKDLESIEEQAMTQRIFEVGQAAIEAGKNMILAQQSHVDKEKIYDIVGTRNVTSVGRYLITIGEELLNRGKAFGSKKISSSKVPVKYKSPSNFDNTSKILTGGVTNAEYTLKSEPNIINTITSRKTVNLSCGVGKIHRNSSLRGRLGAGLFTPAGEVKGPNQCARRCCENAKCNMGMVVNGECYTVECFHWTLCQIVPYQGSSQFRSAIISIKRFDHYKQKKSKDSFNSSSPANESTISSKRNTSSLHRIKVQDHHPHGAFPEEEFQNNSDTDNPNQSSAQGPTWKGSEKSTYSQHFDELRGEPKATSVQRKELNCRSSETMGSGSLEPGSWRLGGKTRNGSKCVELCCSQSGCDLAFQIGEFCYSLACYEDNRGCNPLALPVGLSYLRFKRREKLAPKHTGNLEDKLPRKVVSNRTAQSEKKNVLEKPTEGEGDGIPSPSAKVFNKMIQPTNWYGSEVSGLCGCSVWRNTFFRAGHNAGEFRQARNISNVRTCAENCCNSTSCDVAYMVENICFLVKCRDESSCEPVYLHNFEYPSSLVYITKKNTGKASFHPENKSLIAKENESSMNKEELLINLAGTPESRGEKSDISNKIVKGRDVNRKGNELPQRGHVKAVGRGNDLDFVVDNDNDGEIIKDADDDIHDYGTGDDDYLSREEVNGSKNHNPFSEHTIGSEDNISKDINYNRPNNTANYPNIHFNKDQILTQPIFVAPYQTASPKNHTKLTPHTRNESLTADHQEHGISATGVPDQKEVNGGPRNISYSPSTTLPDSTQTDYSGSGTRDHEESNIVDAIFGHDDKGSDPEGVGSHVDIHSGSSSIDTPEEDREKESHDDAGVEVNNISEPDIGLADPKNLFSLDTEVAKPDSGNKSIPHTISKENQVQKAQKSLTKKGDKSLGLSLQPPVLKDKDSNDETYVIYDDVDNGEGFRSGDTLRNLSSSDATALASNKRHSHKSPFIIQNNRSEKPSSKGNYIKITGVNNASVNATKSLNQSSIREGDIHHFDIHKSTSDKNKTLPKLKNSTLVNMNDTYKNLNEETRLHNKTDDTNLGKSVMNINENSLRQRGVSGDIIPKRASDKSTSGATLYSEEKKVPTHKSNSQGKKYGGNEILKQVELQDYPFHSFPLKREGYLENVDKKWPFEVIPLDVAFPELQINNTIPIKNPGFGLTEVPNNNLNNQSNIDLPPTMANSKTEEIREITDGDKNRKLFNETLPNLSTSTREVSVNRLQLHNNLKAVLKSYYADAEKNKMLSSRTNYKSNDFNEEGKNRFLSTSNSTEQQNRFHESSSKLSHLKDGNHISVDEAKISNNSIPEKVKNNSLSDQEMDHVRKQYEKVKGDGENPFWIVGNPEDLNNNRRKAESLGLLPKNEANTEFVNSNEFNPFTPFMFNDQQKLQNIKKKINSPKQMVRDKSQMGDIIPGTIEHSGKKNEISPDNKKPDDTKYLPNVTNLAEKSDKGIIFTSHKRKADNESNERTKAAENNTLMINGSPENGVSHDNHGKGNYVEDSINANSTFENSTTDVRSNQTVFKATSTAGSNSMPKSEPTAGQTSKQKYVDSSIDDLLGNKKKPKNAEDNFKKIGGWTGDKKLENTSSRSDQTKIDMMPLDQQKVQSIHRFTVHSNSSLNKVKPHRYVVEKKNENELSHAVNNSSNEAKQEMEKVQIGSLKSNVRSNKDKAPKEHFDRESKQKSEIKKTKDQHIGLRIFNGEDSLSRNKGENKIIKNNIHVLVGINETKLPKESNNAVNELINNKSGYNTKTKNLHFENIPPAQSKSSLWDKNSKGDVIPKYTWNKDIDNISENDIMELARPHNLDNTEFNRSTDGIESAGEEILDDDHSIAADEDSTDRNIRKLRKLPQNNGEHKAIKGDKFGHISVGNKIDGMLPVEQFEYSNLGQILFNNTLDAIEASNLLNRPPEIQGKTDHNKSQNYTSAENISSNRRNSSNIRPWALNGKETNSKDITGKEKSNLNTIQMPRSDNETRLWGRNAHGDEIPRPDMGIVRTKYIGNEDKQTFQDMKNKSKVGDNLNKNGEDKIRKWGKGSKFHDTNLGENQEELSTGENANLWERNTEGDAIPKPDHDWLSEDEMEKPLSKPDHRNRLANEERENVVDENDIDYGNRIELEEISDSAKHLPTARNSRVFLDDIEDFNPNSDPNFGEEKNKNVEDTDTRFEDVDNEFHRNIIPLSKEDGTEKEQGDGKQQGKNLIS